jgi:hypothetical protein
MCTPEHVIRARHAWAIMTKGDGYKEPVALVMVEEPSTASSSDSLQTRPSKAAVCRGKTSNPLGGRAMDLVGTWRKHPHCVSFGLIRSAPESWMVFS